MPFGKFLPLGCALQTLQVGGPLCLSVNRLCLPERHYKSKNSSHLVVLHSSRINLLCFSRWTFSARQNVADRKSSVLDAAGSLLSECCLSLRKGLSNKPPYFVSLHLIERFGKSIQKPPCFASLHHWSTKASGLYLLQGFTM